MKPIKRTTSGILAVCCLMMWPSVNAMGETTAGSQQETAIRQTTSNYREYIKSCGSTVRPDTDIYVDIENYTVTGGTATRLENIGGHPGVSVENGEEGAISWSVTVEQSGCYQIEFAYYTKEGKGSSIVRSLLIDGQSPFEEAKTLKFERVYANQKEDASALNAHGFAEDEYGDEIKPVQQEKSCWNTVKLRDPLGYQQEPLQFYFTEGTHTITLESIRENLVLGSIRLTNEAEPSAYTEPSAEKLAVSNATQPIRIQGEHAIYKSDSSLTPTSDNASYNTDPSDPSKLLLNTIGGDKWKSVGQWLEWEFSVPETGYYKLAFKGRQNLVSGQPSYRRLSIDGKLPFAEAENLRFEYGSGWTLTELGDGTNPYLIYLEAGKTHNVRLEVTLGALAKLIQEVDDCTLRLSADYRSILMVVGQDVDVNRDYDLKGKIPDVLENLRAEGQKLKEYYDEYVQLTGIKNAQAQILLNMSKQTLLMAEKPHKIPSLLSEFSNNISSLGTWLTTARSQPLEIDYIEIAGKDAAFEQPESNVFKSLWFGIQQFIASFTDDYNLVKDASKERQVTVWLTSGRDQASSLSQLAKNYFTPATGISANIQLVPAGTLLTATLANKGPDVSLSLAQSDPMNYAIRGAVVDLSQFDDFEAISARFQPSAMLPLTFQGAAYGLPETQSFPMLFYRQDILDELNLEVPETWEDVMAILPVLQKKNLTFGLPLPNITSGLGAYAIFLFQRGGALYNEELSGSQLNSVAGAEAFEQWTAFYTDYSLSMQYDFNTRFRSGEMPIGIADYGTYNSLSVFAPELDGQWSFALVPGTRQEDGTINHAVASTITASVMMRDAADKKACWEFLKWWTSSETQNLYGRELESIMGTAARYQTANVEAIYNIPWNTKDFQVLIKQLNWTKGIEEIPGSYITPRFLDFAFKKVAVSGADDVNKVLVHASRQIDSEIQAKRQEFGLDR